MGEFALVVIGGDALEQGFDLLEGGLVEGVVVDLFGDDFGHVLIYKFISLGRGV